ncbi:MAG: HAMP domain-containing protein [Gemmatimonadetes bacterium]|nr:HAMP domain-containing protein [Gemmatimonadota bacterium]
MTLTRRLLLGVFGVMGSLVIFLSFLVDRQLSRRLQDDTADVLTREARFVAASWVVTTDPFELAHRAGDATGRRITLIDSSGAVVGDSDFDRAGMSGLENHAARPEVAAAMRGSVGSALRASASRGDRELYVAVPAGSGVARVSVPTTALNSLAASTRRGIAFAGGVALLVALGMAWLFARNVSRPIVSLRDLATTYASGNLTARPDIRAPGEVGDLSRALHQLAEQLSARLDALAAEESLLRQLTESVTEGVVAVDAQRMVVRINAHARAILGAAGALPFPANQLPREVAFRAALDGALAGDSTDDLEMNISGRTVSVTALPLPGRGAVLALYDLTRLRRLEAVRRTFVANVSHELRTPLTVIGGFAETIAGDDLPDVERRQFAHKILSNTKRLQRIVDDLLDLSRIEQGGWTPNPARTDLASAVADSLAAVRETATRKGIALETAVAADAREAWADPTALRQVLSNLVDNAVRHTNTGSIVVFSQARTGGAVVIGVRDTGVGIGSEHLPRIFERFYRVDAARSRAEGGTGLGLAIVKHLVEAHGGRVAAESVLGVGTTVHAEFPGPPGEER